jgi:inosose dehydratase
LPIDIANAPCSWAVYRADDPDNLPWARFLDEVAAAGYRGTELGPTGWLPEDPARLQDELAERDLSLVAGSVMAPFNERAARAETHEKTRRTCRGLGALGARYHVVRAD